MYSIKKWSGSFIHVCGMIIMCICFHVFIYMISDYHTFSKISKKSLEFLEIFTNDDFLEYFLHDIFARADA